MMMIRCNAKVVTRQRDDPPPYTYMKIELFPPQIDNNGMHLNALKLIKLHPKKLDSKLVVQLQIVSTQQRSANSLENNN